MGQNGRCDRFRQTPVHRQPAAHFRVVGADDFAFHLVRRNTPAPAHFLRLHEILGHVVFQDDFANVVQQPVDEGLIGLQRQPDGPGSVPMPAAE